MGKEKKANKPNKSVRKIRKKWLVPLFFPLFMGLTIAGVYSLINKSSAETAAVISQKKETPDFKRLIGSWVRPDGGYVIEIGKIHPDGKADVAYFNPRPIHVSRSNVSETDVPDPLMS